MKILQVVDILNIGGAERVAVDLSNILSENGVDVTFLSLLQKGPLSGALNPCIPQLELKRSHRFSPVALFRFISIAKGFDIIHIHMSQNLRYVALASILYPSLKNKIVFHDHSNRMNLDNNYSKTVRLAQRYSINTYIGVSRQLTDWAMSNGVKQAYVLPNIIRRKLRTETVDNPAGYVSVGNVRPEKNYEFLLKLASYLPNRSFTIYGSSNVAPYLAKITQQAGNNVQIVDGVSDIQAVLPKYKVAIHCAPSETGPLVLIEYLAQGIPFITYRTGEVAEQIQHDLPELIMDNFEVGQWLERIEYIENNYEALQGRLIKVFEKNYAEKKYVEQCMNIYKNALNY